MAVVFFLGTGTEGSDGLRELLRAVAALTARVHDAILRFNDANELGLSDKQLHMAVAALLGLCLFAVVQTVFGRLARRGVTAISWLYTFTVIAFAAFAVEVGQYGAGTGTMSLADAASGLWGFLLMFAAVTAVRRLLGRKKKAK